VPDRVYLVLASSLTPGVTSLADAHAVFDDPPEGFKRAIEGIGDVDGDGLDDVALGGFGSSTQIMLYLGSDLSAGGTFTYADAHATFDNGEDSVAGLGDLDGDGLDDLLLGDPWYTPNGVSNSGRALVWYGASLAAGGTFAAEDADVTLIGEGGHNKLGAAVAAAGDVDGDGLPDLLISAPGWEGVVMGGGKVYLVLGSQLPVSGSFPPASAHASILGTTRNGFLGEYGGLAGGADVDGDGLHDVVVSAWRDEEVGFEAGATWLFSGATLASGGTLLVSSADAAFVGEATGDRSGVVIDLTGDHDGDGRAEVLVGAEYNDEGGSQAGKVYLLAMPP
jgi:hypothetical protein